MTKNAKGKEYRLRKYKKRIATDKLPAKNAGSLNVRMVLFVKRSIKLQATE